MEADRKSDLHAETMTTRTRDPRAAVPTLKNSKHPGEEEEEEW